MLRVLRNHRRAACERDAGLRGPAHPAGAARCRQLPRPGLVEAARRAWDDALAMAERQGVRNAQVTVIAPTGTIGLVMDCDTTGIEPDFALVKFKKLAGGGYFKIINRIGAEGTGDAGLQRPSRSTTSCAMRWGTARWTGAGDQP